MPCVGAVTVIHPPIVLTMTVPALPAILVADPAMPTYPARALRRPMRSPSWVGLVLLAAACIEPQSATRDTGATSAAAADSPAPQVAASDEYPPPPPPSYPVADGDDRMMPLPLPGWYVAASEETDSTPSDLGHGVVYVVQRHDTVTPYPRVDTLWFRAAPDSGSAVVGAVVTNLRAAGWARYADVWAPEPLTGNWVEFEYDESGIPFDSVDAGGSWHRTILGFARDGSPWLGWAALGDSVLARVTWKEKLVDNSIYFRDFHAGSFHAQPDGPVVTTPMALADSGFDVTSGEARWPWLRVKVEHPGDVCNGAPENRRADYYWVRALDDRGRPLVFFPTRGC